MLYQCDLTIPSGTTEASPASATMVLCEGTIRGASVLFPAGCAGLARVQVWLGGFQLVPWSRSKWLRGDDHLIPLDLDYPVGPAPRLLTVYGYNEDETYDHTVTVSVNVHSTYVSEGGVPADLLLQELGLV